MTKIYYCELQVKRLAFILVYELFFFEKQVKRDIVKKETSLTVILWFELKELVNSWMRQTLFKKYSLVISVSAISNIGPTYTLNNNVGKPFILYVKL